MNDMHDSLDDEKLRRLLDEADKLPREAEPPGGAWNAIRGRIDAQRVVPIAPNAGGAPTGRTSRTGRWWQVAASAGVVIAVSVAVKSDRRTIETAIVSADSTTHLPSVPLPPRPDSTPARSVAPVVTATPVSLTK